MAHDEQKRQLQVETDPNMKGDEPALPPKVKATIDQIKKEINGEAKTPAVTPPAAKKPAVAHAKDKPPASDVAKPPEPITLEDIASLRGTLDKTVEVKKAAIKKAAEKDNSPAMQQKIDGQLAKVDETFKPLYDNLKEAEKNAKPSGKPSTILSDVDHAKNKQFVADFYDGLSKGIDSTKKMIDDFFKGIGDMVSGKPDPKKKEEHKDGAAAEGQTSGGTESGKTDILAGVKNMGTGGWLGLFGGGLLGWLAGGVFGGGPIGTVISVILVPLFAMLGMSFGKEHFGGGAGKSVSSGTGMGGPERQRGHGKGMSASVSSGDLPGPDVQYGPLGNSFAYKHVDRSEVLTPTRLPGQISLAQHLQDIGAMQPSSKESHNARPDALTGLPRGGELTYRETRDLRLRY